MANSTRLTAKLDKTNKLKCCFTQAWSQAKQISDEETHFFSFACGLKKYISFHLPAFTTLVDLYCLIEPYKLAHGLHQL